MKRDPLKIALALKTGVRDTAYIVADIQNRPENAVMVEIGATGVYIYNDGEKLVARNPLMQFNERITDFYVGKLTGIPAREFLNMLLTHGDSEWFTAEALSDDVVRLACTELSFERLTKVVLEHGARLERKENDL